MSELINSLLKKKGIKRTNQRVALLAILNQAEKPLTVDHLFDALNQQGQRLNLSTIYRILALFEEENLVHKFSYEGLSRAYYERVTSSHTHRLICITCHQMVDLDECPVHAYEERVAKQYGYKIVKHHFELYGICSQCMQSED